MAETDHAGGAGGVYGVADVRLRGCAAVCVGRENGNVTISALKEPQA